MANPVHDSRFVFGRSLRGAASALTLICVLTMVAVHSAQAQTFTVIHAFTGAEDGSFPLAGLAIDRAGNLYGVAGSGGYTGGSCALYGCGTVFRLQNQGSGWLFSTLYIFQGRDGHAPEGVVTGPNASLYGTTLEGGVSQGTLFQLMRPPNVCRSVLCFWHETVLYQFSAFNNGGQFPRNGNLVFDSAGNIYGTTYAGGAYYSGAVYEMTHSGSGWTEEVLYSFGDQGGSGNPYSGVIFDQSGNLYGTTTSGSPSQQGMVYQLTHSGSGWTANVLHNFQCNLDGCDPVGGLIFDTVGNLYGAIAADGPNGGGTVFQLVASQGWRFNLLFSFRGPSGTASGPIDSLTMDAAGNLYGTTNAEGVDGEGSVFKLTPSSGGWILTDLHDFTGGTDGGYPEGGVVLDANGNLYGTTFRGGDLSRCLQQPGCGVVWKITP